MFVELCAVESPDDGLTLLPDSIQVEAIREEPGVRRHARQADGHAWTVGALEAHVVRRGRRSQADTGGQESGLQIELRGNLAAMLTMATRLRAGESGGATAGFGPDFARPQSAMRSPETGGLELQVALVAGAVVLRERQALTVAA